MELCNLDIRAFYQQIEYITCNGYNTLERINRSVVYRLFYSKIISTHFIYLYDLKNINVNMTLQNRRNIIIKLKCETKHYQ